MIFDASMGKTILLEIQGSSDHVAVPSAVFENASIKAVFEASMDKIFAIDYVPPMLQLVFTSRCLKFKAQACVSRLLFLGEKKEKIFEQKFLNQMNF